ncbi:zinc finger CCCH domain-containing protein 3 isoform X2 [Trichomycterus rosablanca]
MAERAALERQIEELQKLIKDHKRIHGDAASSSAHWSSRRGLGRGRGHNPQYPHSYSHQTQQYPTNQWRKTYSLNKTTRAPAKGPSQVSEPSVVPPAYSTADSKTLTSISKESTVTLSSLTENKSSLETRENRVSAADGMRTVQKPAKTKSQAATKSSADMNVPGQQSGFELNRESNKTLNMGSSSLPASEETSTFIKKDISASSPGKTHHTSTISTNKTAHNLPSSASTVPGSTIRLKEDSAAPVQAASSPNKSSRFTWVKNQNSKQSTSTVSAPAAPPAVAVQTHSSNRKRCRRLSLSSGAPKISKYSWVSTSCSSSTGAKVPAKLPHKPLSPKSPKVPGKTIKEKLASTPLSSKRLKVNGGASTPHLGQASRYRWKAVAAASPVAVCTSTPKSSRKGSAYQWTAKREEKNSGLLPSRVQHCTSTPPSSGGFRLKSRTKIIRRLSNSHSTPERRSSFSVMTVKSRYSLRRRTQPTVKTPAGARRGQSRALVALGRHKLRPLSTFSTAAWNSRAGSSFASVQSAASHRVIKTRYKIDTRRAPHPGYHNSALSYRVKRVQSARTLLQNRLRALPDRHWRGRGMRWIGGALYQVSANKLSRTQMTSTPCNRSEKVWSLQDLSPANGGRTSITRHIASRAVQRSLAIIRQAHQKKQQAKHYCMYFNRFGKCKRGAACPYIHDSDKVAVCTRFLRGTCKQTDGTCPFSHKVSKEKMPVCLYFLKGICNNSSCPYSHVYVSRKAAVCQDFVRGYCPQGEK